MGQGSLGGSLKEAYNQQGPGNHDLLVLDKGLNIYQVQCPQILNVSKESPGALINKAGSGGPSWIPI